MNLRRISEYSVAATNTAAFVIGGYIGVSARVIAKYENDEWSHYGNLRKNRHGHGSITLGTKTMVFGGWSSGFGP